MASAIDTPLPKPRAEDVYRVWMNKESICSWVTVPEIDEKQNFSENSSYSMVEWHKLMLSTLIKYIVS
jgi:hypothetical protein